MTRVEEIDALFPSKYLISASLFATLCCSEILRKDFDQMQLQGLIKSSQLLGPYLLMNLFSPIWTPECASSILGEHWRGWETEEQHRE